MAEPGDLARLAGVHDGIAAAVPQIARGIVWCASCGSSMPVDGARCLRSGWPICCGQTMTIDSPAERARAGQAAHGS